MYISPSSLSLGGILEGYFDSPQVTSEASKVKGYSDWDCDGFFPLVTPALSGSEEAVILVW